MRTMQEQRAETREDVQTQDVPSIFRLAAALASSFVAAGIALFAIFILVDLAGSYGYAEALTGGWWVLALIMLGLASMFAALAARLFKPPPRDR